MVLSGCSELLDRSLPKESPAHTYLDQIQRITEKATAITKQLVAFSRKQVVEFRAVDLHVTLTESNSGCPACLVRISNSAFVMEARQSWILSDPSQLDQVVPNLAINARDAMPGVAASQSRRGTLRAFRTILPIPMHARKIGWCWNRRYGDGHRRETSRANFRALLHD